MAAERLTIGDLVENTPTDRDRFVDFLRAASILAVILGHWTISVVTRDGGRLQVSSALDSSRWMQGATWLIQVMPVFFFVGGFSNLRSLGGGGGRHGPLAYLRGRVDRLMRPTLLFALVWLAAVAVLSVTTADASLVREAGHLAAQPLWFLAVYLLVVTAAPVMVAAHRRSRVVPLAVLAGAVVLVDVGRLHWGLDGLAMANYLLVFLFAQQLGFAYGDGTLTGVPRGRLLAVAAGAFAGLALLTGPGPYPLSMVGVSGELSNMSPPTLCILVLTVGQVALLMALRPAAERWLQRRRVWTATVVVNARIMTIFLWHLTAILVAGLALIALDLPLPAAAGRQWWLLRPVWLATALVVLLGLVAAFGWAEQPSPRDDRPRAGTLVVALIGVALIVRGLIGLALDGFAPALASPDRSFLFLALSPALDTALMVAGYVLVDGIRRRERTPPALSPPVSPGA